MATTNGDAANESRGWAATFRALLADRMWDDPHYRQEAMRLLFDLITNYPKWQSLYLEAKAAGNRFPVFSIVLSEDLHAYLRGSIDDIDRLAVTSREEAIDIWDLAKIAEENGEAAELAKDLARDDLPPNTVFIIALWDDALRWVRGRVNEGYIHAARSH